MLPVPAPFVASPTAWVDVWTAGREEAVHSGKPSSRVHCGASSGELSEELEQVRSTFRLGSLAARGNCRHCVTSAVVSGAAKKLRRFRIQNRAQTADGPAWLGWPPRGGPAAPALATPAAAQLSPPLDELREVIPREDLAGLQSVGV